MTTVTVKQKLAKARTCLILDHPFFGALLMRLKMVEDAGIPTACTDGQQIRYNPEFFDCLQLQEVVGVLAHEVLHIANGHCWRRDSRDPQGWNISTDMSINGILLDAGLKLPEGRLHDPSCKDLSAEEIFARMPKQPQGQPGQKGQSGGQGQGQPGQGQPASDPGGCGAVEDASECAEGKQGDLEREWKVAVSQAATAAKAIGALPASLDRMVQNIVDPKVPWSVLLRDFVERTARNDYNWARPNRRHLSRGFVLPSLISEELPEVVIVVDTSGSIGQAELDEFAAEASAVLGAYETTIHLVYADAKVQGHEVVTRADLPLTLKPVGGGGTDFRPAFDWVREQGLTPALLIYLTDNYGRHPDQEPDYPVLWVCTTDKEAPWGQTVKLN